MTSPFFHDADRAFAELLGRLSGDARSCDLELAAAMVSRAATADKEICLDLNVCADALLRDLFPGVDSGLEGASIRTPGLTSWMQALQRSPVVGAPGDYRPLVLDGEGRLYLYRFWRYETRIASFIAERTGREREFILPDHLKNALRRYFTGSPTTPDWQKVAAFSSLTGRFCVISGGPGTGKTHTVTHIMALLLEQTPGLRIAACAPTGKAAARLVESIRRVKAGMDCPAGIRDLVPDSAGTIHRLLGGGPGSAGFRHNRDNPLEVDVLIVDEASMVSLALMARLMDALPDNARLILLGDKDQLASVEAGAVLGDICEAAAMERFSKGFQEGYKRAVDEEMGGAKGSANADALADCLTELKHSYRFEASGGIGAVSRAVNAGRDDEALEWIDKDGISVVLRSLPEGVRFADALRETVLRRFVPLIQASTLDLAFTALDRFRLLCAHREGRYGIANMNRMVRDILREEGVIDHDRPLYKGLPLIVTRNDYILKLYNGDVGLVWEKDGGGGLRVYFPDREETFRGVSPGRLPGCDDVYAMTIHKSQGSEFDEILMILPDRESPVLTRELIYTGMTRARNRVEIWANRSVFRKAVKARLRRRSGLRAALEKIAGTVSSLIDT